MRDHAREIFDSPKYPMRKLAVSILAVAAATLMIGTAEAKHRCIAPSGAYKDTNSECPVGWRRTKLPAERCKDAKAHEARERARLGNNITGDQARKLSSATWDACHGT